MHVEVAAVQQPGFEPQARHQNKMQKVFLRRYPLSRAKALRVNKIAMKSFPKNLSFGIDFKIEGPATYVSKN